MFSFKKKLDKSLAISLKNKYYKKYRVIIHYKALSDKTINKIKIFSGIVLKHMTAINCISAVITPKAIERLLELPQIDYITNDSLAFLCGSSILGSNGINFKNESPLSGKGIGIGVIDSGVYPHQDLLYPSNRIKTFLDLVNDYKYPYDDNGHGTFISGVIAGSGKASKGLYKGIAPNSNIYCIKAFNDIGRAHISDILYGLQYLIENHQAYNLKVICLPFELIDNDYFVLKLFSALFQMSLDKGICPVVPTGHNGNEEGSLRGISILANCITVGGINTNGKISAYKHSSSGSYGSLEKPNLSAACQDICSLNSNVTYISERNGKKLYPKQLEKPYTNYSGTSIAAAYISGIIALLYEKKPNIKFDDVKSLLKLSCDMHKISKWLQGNGTINIDTLINEAFTK